MYNFLSYLQQVEHDHTTILEPCTSLNNQQEAHKTRTCVINY